MGFRQGWQGVGSGLIRVLPYQPRINPVSTYTEGRRYLLISKEVSAFHFEITSTQA